MPAPTCALVLERLERARRASRRRSSRARSNGGSPRFSTSRSSTSEAARAAGARIALDDVGAAAAPGRSLASGLDELKLSRALISRATADASARADLHALIELGRDYRLTVVAVGVEDKATYDLVASLGCDL